MNIIIGVLIFLIAGLSIGGYCFVSKTSKKRDTKEEIAPVPSHRWGVVTHNLEHKQRETLLSKHPS